MSNQSQPIDSLTILVPTRNRPYELAQCLASIEFAFGPGQKIIVGDNGNASKTKDVFCKFVHLNLVHMSNPPGSTYVDNLRFLLHACETPWASVLHDDDYFVSGISKIVRPWLDDRDTDFIFSDHWMSDSTGKILPEATETISRMYGRSKLRRGVQTNPGVLATKQKIALDGFFVRTELALKNQLDPRYAVASDIKWLIETCASSKKTIYLEDRLFVYRISENSLTSRPDFVKANCEMWAAIRSIRVSDPATKSALQIRKRAVFANLIRSLISRCVPQNIRRMLKWRKNLATLEKSRLVNLLA